MEDYKRLLFEQLVAKFDKIYILTMSNRPDRRELIYKQFEKLGLPLPDDTNFIRYYYGTPFPYNNILAKAMNDSKRGKFSKPNEFDCSRNHYAMIRICYDLGFEHCLVLEDDVLLLNDAKTLYEYFLEIPANYDILQFGGFTSDEAINKFISKHEEKWVKHKPVGVWNTSGYALSRRGMEFYLTFMDKIAFWVADGPLYKAPLSDKIINTYLSDIPLVIQADKNVIASDIRTKNNDTIDYNNDNQYEKEIDLNNYFKIEELQEK